MAKYRIKYSVFEQGKYISHLDLAKLFERSMRRAQIEMAFSEGFNPHPKFSFGSALAVGVSSSGEYLEIELTEQIEPELMKEKLNNVLPIGFKILEVRENKEKSKTLMAIIDRAVYQVDVPLLESPQQTITQQQLDQAIQELMDSDQLKVMRKTKKGITEKDIRLGVFKLSGLVAQEKITLQMTLVTGSQGNVRPEEITSLVLEKLAVKTPIKLLQIHREGLYVQKDGEIKSAPWEGE